MTDEYNKFFTAISLSRFWKPFCYTLSNTKMDIDDTLLLKWKDVDLENKTLNLYSANPISNRLVEILKEYKSYREREQRRKQFSYTADEDLVFGNKRSELRSSSGISHVLKKYLKHFGLQNTPITLRSLKGYHLKTDSFLNTQNNSKNKDFEM